MFYSSVILSSTETDRLAVQFFYRFYSSVILNSTETDEEWMKEEKKVLQ